MGRTLDDIYGAKGDSDFWMSELVKNPDVTDLTPVVNFGEVRRAQLAKSTLLTSTLGPPGIFSDLLRCIQMLHREWGAESNGKLPYLFVPCKTATLVREFVVEDLSSAELLPTFLPLQ